MRVVVALVAVVSIAGLLFVAGHMLRNGVGAPRRAVPEHAVMPPAYVDFTSRRGIHDRLLRSVQRPPGATALPKQVHAEPVEIRAAALNVESKFPTMPSEVLPRLALPMDTKRVPWLPGRHNRRLGQLSVSGHTLTWEVLHDEYPRVLYLHNVLTAAERAEIVDVANRTLRRSQVISNQQTTDAKEEVNEVRTSQGTFLQDFSTGMFTPANQVYRERIAAVVGVASKECMEATQVLRYTAGKRYVPHTDFFRANDAFSMNRGGQRIATAISWLNDCDKGGETSFPAARPQAIYAKPRAGDGVIFFDVHEDMTVDPASLHGGDPPAPGSEKWVAIEWLHPRVFS